MAYLYTRIPLLILSANIFYDRKIPGKTDIENRRKNGSETRSNELTGDDGVLQIVLGRAGFPDLRKVLELATAQFKLAAQVRLLQDSLKAPGELLLYVAAHV